MKKKPFNPLLEDFSWKPLMHTTLGRMVPLTVFQSSFRGFLLKEYIVEIEAKIDEINTFNPLLEDFSWKEYTIKWDTYAEGSTFNPLLEDFSWKPHPAGVRKTWRWCDLSILF